MRESIVRMWIEQNKKKRTEKFKCLCKYKSGLVLQLIQRIHLKEYVVSRYTTCGQRKSVIIDKTNQPKNNYQKCSWWISCPYWRFAASGTFIHFLFIFFFSSLQGSNVSVWPCTPIWVFWNRRIGHTHTRAQARFLFLSSERKILRTRFGNWLALSTRRIYRIQLMVALIVYGMVFSHCILMEPHAPNTYLIETLHLLCPGICF